jgi:hypothetical protein
MRFDQMRLKFDEIAKMLKIFNVIFDTPPEAYAAQLFIQATGRGRGRVCHAARNWPKDRPQAGPPPAET